jgi:hypothetical protein
MISNINNYRKRYGEYLVTIPNIALEYKPKVTRDKAGRPRNEWTFEFETVHRPNP